MFVTASDFQKPYNIPNLNAVVNTFPTYVEKKEKEALKSLLGLTLYESFVDGLDTDYPEERWINLREGHQYIYKSKTYEWVGMKELLVPYIYSEWVRDDDSILTGVGTAKSKTENAQRLKPLRKISDAYNDYARIAGNGCEHKNTLYGFLYQEGKAGTFDDSFDESFQTFVSYINVNFQDPGRVNPWGI